MPLTTDSLEDFASFNWNDLMFRAAAAVGMDFKYAGYAYQGMV